MDVKKERKIKRELITKRKKIRKKLQILKHGEIATEKKFEPITKHLQIIEKKLPINEDKPQVDDVNEEENSYKEFITSSPIQKLPPTRTRPNVSKQSIINELSNEENAREQSYIRHVKDQNKHAALSEYLEQYPPLIRKYIAEKILDESKEMHEFDTGPFAIQHDPITDKLTIGDSEIHIDGNDLIIKGQAFHGTSGLFELLFKKNPRRHTRGDEINFKNILRLTNAARKSYAQPPPTPPHEIEGAGLAMEVNNNKIDYVYFDDINEIVDRLRLLIASSQAGNNGHTNEINSIIEELREAEVIV